MDASRIAVFLLTLVFMATLLTILFLALREHDRSKKSTFAKQKRLERLREKYSSENIAHMSPEEIVEAVEQLSGGKYDE